MKIDCPIRGFCNKFTKTIMAVGIVLLLTGLFFCNSPRTTGEQVGATTEIDIPSSKGGDCSEARCKKRQSKKRIKKRANPSIQNQQREMKDRLSRMNKKVEKLKHRRGKDKK